MNRAAQPRILAITTVDVMPWILLKPWLHALQRAGYDVHIACARGEYYEGLAAEGFAMHEVALRRSMNPLHHWLPAIQLFRLIRQGGFQIINTHSPVAAAVGRVVAWLAGARHIIYTVHGFYFHEGMGWWRRNLFQAIEWAVGQITSQFMFVSDEDRCTAIATGIVRDSRQATTIYNGVDLDRFRPRENAAPETTFVVGIVARIVQEKGYREFLEMAEQVLRKRSGVSFLVVGDSLASDRDQFGGAFRARIRQSNLTEHFQLTGFTAYVEEYLRMMDVFVLPSYREGFPRSVLEAMACGLPVVATKIRGCREAVVDGETGLLAPPGDAAALTEAVLSLIDHPENARRMGEAGRRRAIEYFDTRTVQDRFVAVFDRIMTSDKSLEEPRAYAAETP
ncbi:MAG: glycosyltransferase family 4 protein [Bryobacteraceae bacterium]|jgi:glycosyltransferase involved in cell wall biosynthesis